MTLTSRGACPCLGRVHFPVRGVILSPRLVAHIYNGELAESTSVGASYFLRRRQVATDSQRSPLVDSEPGLDVANPMMSAVRALKQHGEVAIDRG